MLKTLFTRSIKYQMKLHRNLLHRTMCAQLSPEIIVTDEKKYPEKIVDIVNKISQLTIIEVADLNELLKKELKIKDAPIMPMAAMKAISSMSDEKTEEKKEQTHFNIKLLKFDETKKIALIKAIRSYLVNMNLVQAKKFVEECPAIIKNDVSKEEVEIIKKACEEAGGVVEVY